MNSYGKELILDLHDCIVERFNRESIEEYFKLLCEQIDMQRCEMHFWDDVGAPEEEKQTSLHTKGTSAIQFILTSNITIHTLDVLKRVYLNIFSCKDFDSAKAVDFTVKWFGGKVVSREEVERV